MLASLFSPHILLIVLCYFTILPPFYLYLFSLQLAINNLELGDISFRLCNFLI